MEEPAASRKMYFRMLRYLTEKARIGLGALENGAKVAGRFLQNYPFHPPILHLNQSCVIDHPSTALFQEMDPPVDSSFVALQSGGDGNCLFNSVSIALAGDESMSAELRVRACVDMVLNQDEYKYIHAGSGFDLCSPSLAQSCLEAAVDQEFSSVWAMQGLANVIGTSVYSVYPGINGPSDQLIDVLNRRFHPRVLCRDRDVFIMWSSFDYGHRSPGTWTPNHFVPLIKTEELALPDRD